MSGIGSITNTAKQALLVQQVAIEVTSTNVANANSAGYSKQRAVIVPVSSSQAAKNDIQGGVAVETVERLYDQFIEHQISDQSALACYSETRRDALEQVEAVFNESGREGLSDVMDKFWKAWEDLSFNPSGDVERLAVFSTAENLAATFGDYANQLIDVQDNLNSQIDEQVNQLNGYLSDIASLYDKIVETQAGGGNVNDLLDRRSEMLKKVSEIADISYIQKSDGSLDIFLSNGKAILQGGRYWALDAVPAVTTGFHDVVFEEDPATVLNGVITGGKLGALLDARDTDVQGYLDQLDSLAETLVDEVNSRHAGGFDLNGNVGGLFFDDVAEARYMAVNSDIEADRDLIAASATINSDGANARLMGALKDGLTMNGGQITFSAYFSSLVGQVGMDVDQAKKSYDQRNAVMTALTNQKEQVSGVSIDEEMINLLKYQMGYNAAGKLITATQEMIDTLLGMVK